MNNDLKLKIKNNFFTKCGKLMHETKIRRIHSEIYKELVEITGFLQDDASIAERVYCVMNDITERPLCKTCNKNFVNFSRPNKKYYDYCSTKCMANNDNTTKRRKETNIKRYGCTCNLNSEDGIRKKKETWIRKYGVDNPNKSLEIKENKKQTFLSRYGVSTAGQIEEGKKKSKETCLKKYGVEYTGQIKERQDKMKKTMLERYGVEFYLNKTDIDRRRAKRISSYKRMLEYTTDYPLFSLEEYVRAESRKLRFKCRKCGNDFYSEHFNGFHNPCPVCFPPNENSSLGEQEMRNFIKDLVGKDNIICNDTRTISPYELDIYIPKLNIAVEYDGLYWHSFPKKDRMYHLNKTEMCESKNIHLIHVFESDWIHKNEITKSRLRNMISSNSNKIYARKCSIKEVCDNDKCEFLEKNHLQGNCSSSVNIGLFYEDRIVSLMTFGKARFNKKYEWELLRFCNTMNYSVIGAASKLLKYFENKHHPTSLISYADRRWSNGNLYRKLGFTEINRTTPNYWYWNSHKHHSFLENREKYQKHKLKNILKIFDQDKSEMENMDNNGFCRIYDCGNLVFAKNYRRNEDMTH